MNSGKVLQFPVNYVEPNYEIVQVVIAGKGPMKVLIELPRESLDSIKRIAAAAGDDYREHLMGLSKINL